MPYFGSTSQARLATCHPRLQEICRTIIHVYDLSIVCGHRGELDQNLAHASGKSTLRWPDSKHNTEPSLAVDIAPYYQGRIQWDRFDMFKDLADIFLQEAAIRRTRIFWGGWWPGFKDYPHFQLVEG